MTDNQPKTSNIEKICNETDCAEKIAALSPEEAILFKTFTFCPYCAEEMTLICSACREQLVSGDFKFCPWCGAKFAE